MEKSASAPVPISSGNTPSNLQLNFNSPNGTKPPCEVLTAQWDITGQRGFVPINSQKTTDIFTNSSHYSCKNEDEWDKRTKPDKTGQNLKEKEKVKEKEKEKYFLGGRAACPIDGTKTTANMDKTGTKPPDKFCPTVGQNFCNDFCPVEWDKTSQQNWDKNGQNLLVEFCPSMGQNSYHDFCPDELDKTPLANLGQNGTKPNNEFCPNEADKTSKQKMDKNGQNYNEGFCPNEGQKITTVKWDKNGQNPNTEFCPTIISRAEAEEMIAISEENLYILDNKVLCEDDDREWIIV